MAGYNDTRAKILSALLERPEGTEIQPQDHQEYALSLLEYCRSIELISGSTLIGVAKSNTVPVQPDDANVCYVAGASASITFQNFPGSDGLPITVNINNGEAKFIILIWNRQYWEATEVVTNIAVQQQIDDFLARLQGRSANSTYADPFRILPNGDAASGNGNFTSWDTLIEELDELHGTGSGNQGWWRGTIQGVPVEVFNIVNSYANDIWAQMLFGPAVITGSTGSTTLGQTQTTANIIIRTHNGETGWSDWRYLHQNFITDTYNEQSSLKIASQKALYDLYQATMTAIQSKIDKASISQSTGHDTQQVMSQSAVTTALSSLSASLTTLINGKLSSTDIVQECGTQTDKVMSQKAVTDEFNEFEEWVDEELQKVIHNIDYRLPYVSLDKIDTLTSVDLVRKNSEGYYRSMYNVTTGANNTIVGKLFIFSNPTESSICQVLISYFGSVEGFTPGLTPNNLPAVLWRRYENNAWTDWQDILDPVYEETELIEGSISCDKPNVLEFINANHTATMTVSLLLKTFANQAGSKLPMTDITVIGSRSYNMTSHPVNMTKDNNNNTATGSSTFKDYGDHQMIAQLRYRKKYSTVKYPIRVELPQYIGFSDIDGMTRIVDGYDGIWTTSKMTTLEVKRVAKNVAGTITIPGTGVADEYKYVWFFVPVSMSITEITQPDALNAPFNITDMGSDWELGLAAAAGTKYHAYRSNLPILTTYNKRLTLK